MTPLVSIITPTKDRPESLLRAAATVRFQTFTSWEHVIVFDGPGSEGTSRIRKSFNAKVVELGANYGRGVARMIGTYIASAPLLAYLDDDNEYCRWHLRELVDALADNDVVYSMNLQYHNGESTGEICGSWPPVAGNIDTSCMLHRRELLEVANWQNHPSNGEDWFIVQQWLRAGARCKLLDKVTVRYNKR